MTSTAFELQSSAFQPGKEIPARYTCEGPDTSPQLSWTNAPEGTASFALIVDDPDAPDPAAPKMTYVHWVLYDIPASVTTLEEGAKRPAGARDGINDWHRTGYGGPCPPIGRHRYYFKLYALDKVLGELGPMTKPQLEQVMDGHILGNTQLMGTYQKSR